MPPDLWQFVPSVKMVSAIVFQLGGNGRITHFATTVNGSVREVTSAGVHVYHLQTNLTPNGFQLQRRRRLGFMAGILSFLHRAIIAASRVSRKINP